MTTLKDFTKSKPQLIQCSCGARFSSKLRSCPKCGLTHESEGEIKNWSEI